MLVQTDATCRSLTQRIALAADLVGTPRVPSHRAHHLLWRGHRWLEAHPRGQGRTLMRRALWNLENALRRQFAASRRVRSSGIVRRDRRATPIAMDRRALLKTIEAA